MKKTSVFTFASVLTTLSLLSFSANAKDIRTAILDALDSHPAITQADDDVQIGLYNEKSAISDYYPTVSVNLNGGRFYADTTTTRGLTTDRGAGYSGLFEFTTAVTLYGF